METICDTYKFYCDREEWSDVTPLRQNDHERVVCKINCSDKFIDAYDYIRAVMKKDERSERALILTEDALNLNPANYSVWFYRRTILRELKSDLSYELRFVAELINDNPKNYQVWYHRQWIVDELSRVCDELKSLLEEEFIFIDALLFEENKNYHVWQYRSWLVNHFKMWDYELVFTGKMLDTDSFNNSAWNHRYYSIKAISGLTDNVIEQETEYTFNYIRKAPENEGAWNYLCGLYRGKDLSVYSKLFEFCQDLIKNSSEACKSPYLHSFVLDVNLSKLRRILRLQSGDSLEKQDLLQAVIDTCNLLGDKVDRIRINYWKYRLSQIINEFSRTSNDKV